jgi:hypothetical protein
MPEEALNKQFESLIYFEQAGDSVDIEIAYGTIADIYLLQHSSLYNRILARFANNQEPSQAEVAQLRSRVLQIMLSIPERFASMGLSATQLPMPK